jgi:hypothetical protein
MLASGARRRPDLRDPRAARRGAPQSEEEEETSPGAAIGKGLLAIVLALVIGVGAAYGYYVVSTPKIPVNNAAQPSSTPSPGASTAPDAVALTSLRHPAGLVAFVTVGADSQA